MKYLLCYEVKFAHIEGSVSGHATVDLLHGLTVRGIEDAQRDILEYERPRNKPILSHVIFRSATKLDPDPLANA